jgi:hypothetical protein
MKRYKLHYRQYNTDTWYFVDHFDDLQRAMVESEDIRPIVRKLYPYFEIQLVDTTTGDVVDRTIRPDRSKVVRQAA